jgi:hypothetical protein
MKLATQATVTPTTMLWSGRLMAAVAVLFLFVDGAIKVMNLPVAVDATTQLGYPAGTVFGIGVLELFCLALYVFPRTAVFGALLFTGYLGGVVATHVRAGSDLFSLIFAVLIGAMLWGALYLIDHRLRSFIHSYI